MPSAFFRQRKRSLRRGLAQFFRRGKQQSISCFGCRKFVPDPLELRAPVKIRERLRRLCGVTQSREGYDSRPSFEPEQDGVLSFMWWQTLRVGSFLDEGSFIADFTCKSIDSFVSIPEIVEP